MTEQSTASNDKSPSYSEEQSTQWLAWLAYQMQQHDQAVFQIESIQPSWLVVSSDILIHLQARLFLWGALAGLIFGLTNGLYLGAMGGLGEWLVRTLISQLGIGLSGGIFAVICLIFSMKIQPLDKLLLFISRDHSSLDSAIQRSQIFEASLFGLNFLLIYILYNLFFTILNLISTGTINAVHIAVISDGLYYAVMFSLFYIFRISSRENGRQIQTVESLHWTWQSVIENRKSNLLLGMAFGLSISVYQAILFFASNASTEQFSDLVLFGLNFSIVGGLLAMIIGGFQPGPEEYRAYPNQSIWLTIRSLTKIGLMIALILGVQLWWRSGTLVGAILASSVAGISIALWYGGLDVLEHSIIRLIIARRGHAPLNYAKFLDYAANELNFLQKVGGGYVFIHRYMLEHFAEIAIEEGYVEQGFVEEGDVAE